MQSSSSNPSSASGDSIKVLVRIRSPDSSSSSSLPSATPRNAAVEDVCAFEVEGKTIAEPKAGIKFTYDYVAAQEATQVTAMTKIIMTMTTMIMKMMVMMMMAMLMARC